MNRRHSHVLHGAVLFLGGCAFGDYFPSDGGPGGTPVDSATDARTVDGSAADAGATDLAVADLAIHDMSPIDQSVPVMDLADID